MALTAEEQEIIKKLKTREIKPRDLDALIGPEKANALRLAFIEEMTGTDLSCLVSPILPAQLCNSNIDLMIGAVQVPLGYAGPLVVQGSYAQGEYFIPLATTEGALVASIDRGCSIIRKCGHATVSVVHFGQTRSILFRAPTVQRSMEVANWLKSNWDRVKQEAQTNSRYLKLQHLEPYFVGNNLWLRLEAETGDAMGMNMITFAGEYLGKLVEQQFPDVEFVSASGNICSDKKASSINLLLGRGKYIIAEIIIPDEQIRKYLKATAQQVLDVNYRKNWLGGMLSGSLGYNAHFANIIAAIYLATGQDLGHVVEGSQGFTTMDLKDNNLYVAVTLPCIQVGTIGGGTHLPTQQACLKMLGVSGGGNPPGRHALMFGEIVAAAVLAGELSLIGALAARHLGAAHLLLNR